MPTKSKNNPRQLRLAVIDATTGTVLGPDNLYAVVAPEKKLDAACNSDSDAHYLAKTKGVWISDELLHALCAKKLSKADVYAVAGVFGWNVGVEEGQLVLCTGVKG
jgi:hypothetical protein